jgi:hypothetical protein
MADYGYDGLLLSKVDVDFELPRRHLRGRVVLCGIQNGMPCVRSPLNNEIIRQ